MPLTTMLFLAFFATCGAVGLFRPKWALVGYMAVYLIAPDNVWWGRVIAYWGIRYSFLMAISLAAGLLLNWRSVGFRGPVLLPVEKVMLAFLAWMYIGYRSFGPPIDAELQYGMEKMTKLFIFLMMFTHLVVRQKDLRIPIWVIVLGGLLFGYRAFTAPPSAFYKGRLDALGGPDFAGSNPFALQMAVSGAMTAVLFVLVNKKWLKWGLFVTGGFIVNAIILSRGRGAFLGMLAGAVIALIYAPKRTKPIIIGGLLLVSIGFVFLTDEGYWRRIETTQVESDEEIDPSAQGRLDTWEAGWAMFMDHPLGVGRGKFRYMIGQYDSRYAMRDAHSTYIRCLCELGLPGTVMFVWILWHVFRTILRARRYALFGDDGREFALYAYGLLISLTIYLVGGLFSTMLYVEGLWWLIAFGVCLERVMLFWEEDHAMVPKPEPTKRPPSLPAVARPARGGAA